MAQRSDGHVYAFYRHPVIVQLIAFAIIGNFVINIVEKEIDPDPEDLQFEGFGPSSAYQLESQRRLAAFHDAHRDGA